MSWNWLASGALCAALAVVAGAFGAHALADRLDAHALALWETAARYLMYGGLAQMALGLLARGNPGAAGPREAPTSEDGAQLLAPFWASERQRVHEHRPEPSALPPARLASGAGLCLLLGSLVFSGTVAALALGAPRWLGAVTPLGGLGMIAGFFLLAVAALRS